MGLIGSVKLIAVIYGVNLICGKLKQGAGCNVGRFRDTRYEAAWQCEQSVVSHKGIKPLCAKKERFS